MESKILLKNIQVYGYHGANESEKVNGQNFEIDVLIIPIINNNINDNINNIIDYKSVYSIVVEIFSKDKFNLIETVANNISLKILKRFNVKSCKVAIRKPQVILGGMLDYVEVEVENYGK